MKYLNFFPLARSSLFTETRYRQGKLHFSVLKLGCTEKTRTIKNNDAQNRQKKLGSKISMNAHLLNSS